jgi:hypothetical protein
VGNSGNRDLESEGDAVSGPSAAAPRGQYLEQGFAVVPGLLSSEELDALRQDTDRAVRERIAPILFEDESDAAAAAVPDLYKSPDGRVFRRLNRVIERGGAFERVVFGPLAAAVAGIVPAAPHRVPEPPQHGDAEGAAQPGGRSVAPGRAGVERGDLRAPYRGRRAR